MWATSASLCQLRQPQTFVLAASWHWTPCTVVFCRQRHCPTAVSARGVWLVAVCVSSCCVKFLLFGRLCLQPMPATRWASSLKVVSSAPHLTQHSKDEYSRTCTAPHRKSFHSTSPLALWLETPRCRWVNRCAVLLSAWGRGIYRRKKGWYIYARR